MICAAHAHTLRKVRITVQNELDFLDIDLVVPTKPCALLNTIIAWFQSYQNDD